MSDRIAPASTSREGVGAAGTYGVRLVGDIERTAAAACDATSAVAIEDYRVALGAALRGAGVGTGDRVALPGMATPRERAAVLAIGADPVFVDVDPLTYTMDVDHLARVTERTDVAAVTVTHRYGHPADMDPIARAARRHEFAVVEAVGPSVGATYCGTPVGAIGTAGVLDLDPGGESRESGAPAVVVTDDEPVADAVGEVVADRPNSDDVRTVPERVTALEECVAGRARTAATYRDRLRSVREVRLPYERGDVRHAYDAFVVQTDRRDDLIAALETAGVEAGVPPGPPSALTDGAPGDPTLPRTEQLTDRLVSLPIDARFDDADVAAIRETVDSLFASE